MWSSSSAMAGCFFIAKCPTRRWRNSLILQAKERIMEQHYFNIKESDTEAVIEVYGTIG